MTTAYIALGSNLGDREATLNSALKRLRDLGEVTAVSSIFETDPVGFADQPPYLNAVIELGTKLSAEELLTELQKVEMEYGRERSFQNAPRTLDLDLLLYGDIVIESAELIVPHPRMHERAFVLTPLVEIAPAVSIPALMRSASSLLLDLQPAPGIRIRSTFDHH